MIKTRGRKIIRDIWSRKGRTLLVSASIFIGVLGVVTLFTVRDLTLRQLNEDIREDRLTMIDVFVSAPSDAAIDDDAYLATLNRKNETGQALRTLEGIELVEGQAYYPITFKQPDNGVFVEGELRTYATLLQNVQLEPMRLIEGSVWPTAGQRQVALEKRMAEQYGFEVGDEIVFRATSTEGTREETFTVSGLVIHPYSYPRSTVTNGLGFGPKDGIYAQYEDARFLLDFAGLNIFAARYETFDLAERHFETFQNAIGETTPYVPYYAILEDPANAEQMRNAETIINVLSMLAMVTMIVSGFLVVNMINTIMVEQKNQIGVMKSIGASGRDNFLIYTGNALVYGVIGTLPALIIGVILGYRLALVVAPLMDVLIEDFGWSPSSVLIGALLGLIVPGLAAVIPVYRGIQVSIIEAMIDQGIGTAYGQGWLARRIGTLPLPISIRQAVSNVFQNRGRLVLTVTTLTLALAAFMGVIAVGILFNTEIQNVFDRLGYQIMVIPSEIQDFAEMKETIEGVEGVSAVAPGALASVQVEGGYVNPFTLNNQVTAIALDPAASVFNFNYKDGEGWSKDPTRDGVVITSTMASQLGVSAGDDMTFVVGGNRITQEVIGIDAAIFDSLYLEWTQLATLAGLSQGVPQPNQYTVEATLAGHAEAVIAVGLDVPAIMFFLPEGLESKSVLITQALADAEELAVGETLNLAIGDYTGSHPIAGIVQMPPQFESASQEAILFAFKDLVTLTGVSLEGEPAPNGYFVTMAKDDPSTDEVDAVMERVKQTLLDRGTTGQFQNQLAQAELFTELISQFFSILLIAAALIAAVGTVGLLTTLAISVFERQKEIGVMRSIGAGSTTIATQFLTEGVIVSLTAWVLAIPLSYVIALGLIASFEMESIDFNYPLSALLIGLVGTLVLATLASLGPSLTAARKTVSDILRYQ
jgi:ABC-type antimicrobial peptide transport system permease subunit